MIELGQDLRRWQAASAILALVGLVVSLYLWSSKIGMPLICGVGSCDIVNASAYSSLFGVPVAAIGAGGFGMLLVLALWALTAGAQAPAWLTDVRLLLAFGGVVFSAYLSAIEVFVLRTI